MGVQQYATWVVPLVFKAAIVPSENTEDVGDVLLNQSAEVLQYEATLIVDVTFRRREPSEILWRGQNIRLTEIYAGQRAFPEHVPSRVAALRVLNRPCVCPSTPNYCVPPNYNCQQLP